MPPPLNIDNLEGLDDSKINHKKNNKNNVHLSPLDHNPHNRNSSVPPIMANLNNLTTKSSNVPHPLDFAPSPNQRGGNNNRLESIDHT